MKGIIITVLMLAVAVSAELPSNRKFRSRFLSRQEAESTTPQIAPYPAAAQSGPYPPSGWRPSGAAFTLPARQESSTPALDYGTPSQTYGAPSQTYGAPNQIRNEPSTPVSEEESVNEPQTENVDVSGSERNSKLKEKTQKQVVQNVPAAPASVLVLLPENQLQFQRVVAAPQVIPQSVQYFGQYQSPLGAPFVYTSQYFRLY